MKTPASSPRREEIKLMAGQSYLLDGRTITRQTDGSLRVTSQNNFAAQPALETFTVRPGIEYSTNSYKGVGNQQEQVLYVFPTPKA